MWEGLQHAISDLGDHRVLGPAALLVVGWLAWHGERGLALRLGGALGVASLVVIALKLMTFTPHDTLWADDVAFSQYFPSGHAAMGLVVYGAIGLTLARADRRWQPALPLALVLLAFICFTRLTLRQHPWGDVVGGLVIGAAALGLTGFAARCTPDSSIRPTSLALAFVATLAVFHVLRLPFRILLVSDTY
jgi:membrane-associated phospholipid phosphatase